MISRQGWARLFDRWVSERWVMTIILLNTVAMTAGGFFNEGTNERQVTDSIDYLCVIFFIFEAGWKIYRLGWEGYRASNWNRFDFLVTLMCTPVLLEPFTSGTHYLSWLPVFRAGRLFRLFRLLRFIPDATGLAMGIKRALKASVGVFLALALINLIFALSANFIFGKVAPEHFGDPAKALYSIFQVFTLEGWYEFPGIIEEKVTKGQIAGHWLHIARAFFMLAVLVGGILGFSMANAVFIDEMTLDNNKVLEAKVDALSLEVQQLHRLLAAQLSPPAASLAKTLSPPLAGVSLADASLTEEASPDSDEPQGSTESDLSSKD